VVVSFTGGENGKYLRKHLSTMSSTINTRCTILTLIFFLHLYLLIAIVQIHDLYSV